MVGQGTEAWKLGAVHNLQQDVDVFCLGVEAGRNHHVGEKILLLGRESQFVLAPVVLVGAAEDSEGTLHAAFDGLPLIRQRGQPLEDLGQPLRHLVWRQLYQGLEGERARVALDKAGALSQALLGPLEQPLALRRAVYSDKAGEDRRRCLTDFLLWILQEAQQELACEVFLGTWRILANVRE